MNASLLPNDSVLVFFLLESLAFPLLKRANLEAYFTVSSILSVTQGENVKVLPSYGKAALVITNS